MRTPAAVLGLLAVAALAATAASPAAAATKACSTGGKTLLASADARVYSLAKAEDDPVYACYGKVGKKFKLATFRNCSDSSSFVKGVLAGPFLAYVTSSCGLSEDRQTLVVRDLRTGKVTKTSDATDDSGLDTRFPGLVVTAKGSVAWIGQNVTQATITQVFKWDAGGKGKLDSGTDIDAASLALGGKTLYWLKGSTAKSSTLS